jgi:hypothetical protein
VQPLGGAGKQLALGRRSLEFRRHLALGALDISKVGQEDASSAPTIARPVRNGQPTGFELRRESSPRGADRPPSWSAPLRHQRGESVGPAFAAHLSASFSIS